jgi:hypothetical protein
VGVVADQDQRACRGDRGKEQVDEKAPPPRGVLGQQPTEQQPDRAATAGHRAIDPERPAALLLVLEGVGQRGQGRGRQHRPEHALQGAGGHQHREVGGGPTDR